MPPPSPPAWPATNRSIPAPRDIDGLRALCGAKLIEFPHQTPVVWSGLVWSGLEHVTRPRAHLHTFARRPACVSELTAALLLSLSYPRKRCGVVPGRRSSLSSRPGRRAVSDSTTPSKGLIIIDRSDSVSVSDPVSGLPVDQQHKDYKRNDEVSRFICMMSILLMIIVVNIVLIRIFTSLPGIIIPWIC